MQPNFYKTFLLPVALLMGYHSNAQIVTTFAGNGTSGYNGEEKTALATQLWSPGGLVINGGSVYFADGLNNRLRKVTQAGTVVTLAGNDDPDNTGDDGPATDAHLNHPEGVAIDGHGNIYIADKYNNSIRKITPAGVISTFAGNGESGYNGDGGAANMAQLNAPCALTIDNAGNLFITDGGNNCIRKVTPDGKIATIAGNGREGFRTDSGAATTAQFNTPRGITTDSAGNLYIADALNYRIRRVTPSGTITTVAGNGESGFSGDGEAATAAKLNMPTGVAIDRAGSIYIADHSNNRIRAINTSGIITTAAGGGADTTNQLVAPFYIAADVNGILYVSETENNKIKKVIPPPPVHNIAKVRKKAASNEHPYVPPPFSTPNLHTPPPQYRAGNFHPPSGPPAHPANSGKGR